MTSWTQLMQICKTSWTHITNHFNWSTEHHTIIAYWNGSIYTLNGTILISVGFSFSFKTKSTLLFPWELHYVWSIWIFPNFRTTRNATLPNALSVHKMAHLLPMLLQLKKCLLAKDSHTNSNTQTKLTTTNYLCSLGVYCITLHLYSTLPLSSMFFPYLYSEVKIFFKILLTYIDIKVEEKATLFLQESRQWKNEEKLLYST